MCSVADDLRERQASATPVSEAGAREANARKIRNRSVRGGSIDASDRRLGDDNAAGGFRILGPRREGAASTDRTKLLETTLWCAQQLRLSRPENPGIAPEEQAAFT